MHSFAETPSTSRARARAARGGCGLRAQRVFYAASAAAADPRSSSNPRRRPSRRRIFAVVQPTSADERLALHHHLREAVRGDARGGQQRRQMNAACDARRSLAAPTGETLDADSRSASRQRGLFCRRTPRTPEVRFRARGGVRDGAPRIFGVLQRCLCRREQLLAERVGSGAFSDLAKPRFPPFRPRAAASSRAPSPDSPASAPGAPPPCFCFLRAFWRSSLVIFASISSSFARADAGFVRGEVRANPPRRASPASKRGACRTPRPPREASPRTNRSVILRMQYPWKSNWSSSMSS